MEILCISNGHGEDAIAFNILQQLQQYPQAPNLAVLPLVGEGIAYTQLNIPVIGKVQKMPSGGFINRDGYQLWRDLRSGLIGLTLAQYQVIRKWGQNGGKILAVGDIVPLLFAWLSGTDYVFVGTAKSQYYLRDETGWLSETSWLERKFGSVYYPWETWLMSDRRCKAVFPRDKLTAEILQQRSIRAFALGNPMMDGFVFSEAEKSLDFQQQRSLSILLLPGSRVPEAHRNWQKIIKAIEGIFSVFTDTKLIFLGAISPGLNIAPFREYLLVKGWNDESQNSVEMPIEDSKAVAFTQKNGVLILTQNAYKKCLRIAEVAIAMAGTATEQFVGLGKPAIAIPGSGPQFTYNFAKEQTRLLGCSVILVENPTKVGNVIKSVLSDSQRMKAIALNGKEKMGTSGAGARIANCVMEKFSLVT